MKRIPFPTRHLARGGLALAAAGCMALLATPSAGASTLGGTAQIANPLNPSQALTSGASTTAYTVTLPAQAACSGDSATQGYRVNSYLVPTPTGTQTLTTELQAINWTTGVGSQYYPQDSTTQSLWYHKNTAPSTGEIIGIPIDFTWENLNAVLLSDGLSPLVSSTPGSSATYDLGISCDNSSGALSDYWFQPITFNQSNSDPNGFTWTTQPGAALPESPLPIILPIIGASLLGAGLILVRRRRPKTNATVGA